LLARAFADDKAIGSYIDSLVYATPEQMKFSIIPEAQDVQDERWMEG